MNNRDWKIGIIGCGMIADFHAEAIRFLPNTTLSGFYDVVADNARGKAAKYGVRHWANIDEMLQSDDIDLVMIATPSGAHMEPAILAAKYGKHVLCEKPLEIKLDRIDAMIKAHESAGTYLGGIFNFRFNETTREIKKAIDENRFGIITCASVFVPWWRTDKYYEGWHGTWSMDGGGALMNQSIHMIDLLQYLMGPIDYLGAFSAREGHPQIEAEDTAVSVLQFRNKALGIIYGSTASYPGQFRRLEITGTKGTVVLVENSIQTWSFVDHNEYDAEILQKYSTIEGEGGVSDPSAISFIPHAKNLASFIEAIENNRAFEIDGYESRKAVELISDIYMSCKMKKVIAKT